MKDLLLLSVFISFLGNILFAKTDTTIFTTDFERAVFEQLEAEEPVDTWSLLIAFNYSESRAEAAQIKLDQIKETLDNKGVANKNTKSQVKEIYKTVHSRNLKKYEESVGFCELFENGTYNCVSGTGVYALLMDYYHIPYTIKELPTHVYLVADPDGLEIKVESTLPNQGVIIIDKKAKEQYIDFLRDNKIISEEEFSSSTVEELFQEHYGNEIDIGLKELAGLEYYNEGVKLYNNSEFELAHNNFEKAYRIYPSTTTNYLLYSAAVNLLSEESNKGEFNGRHLANFLNRFSTDSENKNIAEQYYEMATNAMLIENSNLSSFQKFHEDFSTLIEDSVVIDGLQKVYYGNLAYFYYSQGNYSSSLQSVGMSYMLNEKDLKVKNFIKSVTAEYIYSHREDTGIIDTMDYYFSVFPFLLDDFRLLNLYAYTYSNFISNATLNNEITLAIQYLDRMESSISTEDFGIIDHNLVVESYASIVRYYARKKNDKKAGVYIQKGLKVLPKSPLLNEYNDMLNASYTSTSASNTVTPVVSDNTLEDFPTQFPSCWRSAYVIDSEGSEEIPEDEAMVINASNYSKVTFSLDDETETGRWAYRPKSKLLYLIPENDKENYLMFKVFQCNDILVLRMYDGKKLMEPKIYFERCD